MQPMCVVSIDESILANKGGEKLGNTQASYTKITLYFSVNLTGLSRIC